MERKVYVKSLARISACHPDPDYSGMFSVMEARRMSRLMKRALASSQQALSQAGLAVPDAVITGTGLGCIENTEHFLKSLTGISDQPLRPTHFMQSTHNTIGSLIAIRLGCHGYNATYSQGAVSFESALLDAFVQLQMGLLENALVGAFEEMTPDFAAILAKTGRTGAVLPDGRLSETAVSMVLGTSPEGALCELAAVTLCSPAATGHLTRSACMARYGDNFCLSALGICDAVDLLRKEHLEMVRFVNDHETTQATTELKSVCGK